MSVKPGLYIVKMPCNTPVWVQIVPPPPIEEEIDLEDDLEAIASAPTSRINLKEAAREEEASPLSLELAETA